jgi:hypothetical protein
MLPVVPSAVKPGDLAVKSDSRFMDLPTDILKLTRIYRLLI